MYFYNSMTQSRKSEINFIQTFFTDNKDSLKEKINKNIMK